MKTSIIKKNVAVIGMTAMFVLTASLQTEAGIRGGSRTTRSSSNTRQNAVIVAPNSNAQNDMWVEVNRTERRATSVTIFRTGERIQNATLRIFDEHGNQVRRMSVSDRGARSGRDERSIGTWDLTDMTGRRVRGTFTIEGTVRTQSGRSETVDLTFSTRGGGGGHHHGGEHRRGGRDRVTSTDVEVVAPATDAPATPQVVEAVPLPAEIPADMIPEEPAPAVEQTPPDPNAQLRGDRDAFFERLDAAVGE